MLTDVSHIYCKVTIIQQIVYGFICFPDYDKELTAGVISMTDQQRILIFRTVMLIWSELWLLSLRWVSDVSLTFNYVH